MGPRVSSASSSSPLSTPLLGGQRPSMNHKDRTVVIYEIDHLKQLADRRCAVPQPPLIPKRRWIRAARVIHPVLDLAHRQSVLFDFADVPGDPAKVIEHLLCSIYR